MMDLCHACETGDLDELIKVLSSSSCKVNDLIGSHQVRRTALHHAAQYGHLNTVKELVAVSKSIFVKAIFFTI